MNYTTLSLSQTPPLSVPLRFFLTAPLFVMAAALLLIFSGTELFVTRWNPAMLALTHLITLGFLGSCMVGAIQQLLPVLVGVTIPASGRTSALLHGLWTLGSALLVLGMGFGWRLGLQSGALLLGLALAALVLLGGSALWRSASRHASVPAMALALVGLSAAYSIVLILLIRFGWQLPLAHSWTQYHIGWAAVGWIGLLLIGVAYQVVPMFQITPEYPRRMRQGLTPLLGVLLLLWPLAPWPVVDHLIAVMLAVGMGVFALTTLQLQRRRRRQLSDVTLDFWRLAMVSLLSALLLWLFNRVYPHGMLELLVGAVFLLGFAYSAVNGMLYKIVPFLVWLHLNNRLQRAGRSQAKIPNMKQVIPERYARRQFRLHLVAMAVLLIAIIRPELPPALVGVLWLGNGGWLGWNLWQALRLYRRMTREQG
jgi:hypothetical protein